ncbi:MAG: carboxypeptidase regulatory-like domain-containing protein, partial [Planctomycetota bacterium]
MRRLLILSGLLLVSLLVLLLRSAPRQARADRRNGGATGSEAGIRARREDGPVLRIHGSAVKTTWEDWFDSSKHVVAVGARVRLYPGHDPLAVETVDPEMIFVERDEALRETRTDAAGRFELLPPGEGHWTLLVTADGCAPWQTYCTTVADSPEAKVHAELLPGDHAEFTVVDREQRPVPGARVAVVRWDPLSAPTTSTPERTLAYRTDEEGRVRVVIGLLRALSVSAEGYAPRLIQGHSELRDGLIVLSPAWRIAGTVVDGTGRQVAGAEVRFGWDQTKTAADGAFELEGLEPGTHDLFTEAPGYLTDHREVVSGDTSVLIRLRRPATVFGVVVYPDGRPAAGAELEHGSQDTPVIANERGEFTLEGVRPFGTSIDARVGRIAAPVKLDDWVYAYRGSVRLELQDGETRTGVRVVLQKEAYSFLDLRIQLPDGRPAVGFDAAASRTLYTSSSAESDRHGRLLHVVDAPPGVRLLLAVRGEKRQPGRLLEAVTSAAPGGLIPVRLPRPLRVIFDLRDSEGRPLSPDLGGRSWVRTTAPSLIHWEAWEGWDTEEPPRQRIPWVVNPGLRYNLHFAARGHRGVRLQDWSPPLDGGPVAIRLKRSWTLRGRTVDEKGRPVGRILVECRSGSGRSDEDGEFVIENVPRGATRLSFWQTQGDHWRLHPDSLE